MRAASKLEMALFRQSYLEKKHEYEGFVQELLDLNQNKQCYLVVYFPVAFKNQPQ